MKALFIRCNGKLTPDMLVGGLIDMGVPPAYLRTKLEAAFRSCPDDGKNSDESRVDN